MGVTATGSTRRAAGLARRPVVLALALALPLAGGVILPAGAGAQQPGSMLEVSVTDSLGGPLGGARVALDRIGITGLTDSLGVLRLLAVPPGPLSVVVSQFGYRSDSTRIDLHRGRDHRIRFVLQADPIPVEGIHVGVRNARAQLDFLRGFEERRERGIGYFMTRAEIERSGTADLSNLLHMVPGLRTSPTQFGQSQMRASRTPVTRQCQIKAYVDGMKYRDPDDLAGIPTADIQAIEVYRGRSELPAQFADIDANCGVIVIWSRRFRDVP